MAAREDELAVMSLGIVNSITDSLFQNNSFFCSSGKNGLEEDINEVKVISFLPDIQILCRRAQEETLLFPLWSHSLPAVQLSCKISLVNYKIILT